MVNFVFLHIDCSILIDYNQEFLLTHLLGEFSGYLVIWPYHFYEEPFSELTLEDCLGSCTTLLHSRVVNTATLDIKYLVCTRLPKWLD